MPDGAHQPGYARPSHACSRHALGHLPTIPRISFSCEQKQRPSARRSHAGMTMRGAPSRARQSGFASRGLPVGVCQSGFASRRGSPAESCLSESCPSGISSQGSVDFLRFYLRVCLMASIDFRFAQADFRAISRKARSSRGLVRHRLPSHN